MTLLLRLLAENDVRTRAHLKRGCLRQLPLFMKIEAAHVFVCVVGVCCEACIQ
jgi:hypothetical protein